MKDIGRNDPCPCGSGKKFKKCCLPLQQEIPTAAEKHFITQLLPDVDKQVDDILARMGDESLSNEHHEIEALYKRYPDYHMTNFAMGVVLAHFQKKTAQAAPLFERAIEIFPYFGSAHFNLGNCYLQAGELGKAVDSFRKAKKYAEDGDVSKQASDQLSTIEEIVRTKKLPTLNDYLQDTQIFNQGFNALTAKRYEEAVVLFKRVLEKEPHSVQAFGNMALAYASLGKKALAMECFDKALGIDPKYEPAIMNRIIVSKMIEGEPAVPSQIHETNYYAEYRGEKKRSYVQDVLDSIR